MFLFKVTATKYTTRITAGQPERVRETVESTGFVSREQAGAFARSLAESGRCDGVAIDRYVEVTEDETPPRWREEQVRGACADAGINAPMTEAIVRELPRG